MHTDTAEHDKPYTHPRDLNPHEVALQCQRIGKASAQSSVYILPEKYNRELTLTNDSLDVVSIPSVLKIAHSIKEIMDIVTQLGITGYGAQTLKIQQLLTEGRESTRRVIELAEHDVELSLLFGNPLLVEKMQYEMQANSYHMAYTQDLIRPISDIMAELDTENDEEDLRAACEIVDDYVDAQLFLCTYGFYESTFKFTDNCGKCLYEDQFGGDFRTLRILDLGEISEDFEQLLWHIENKEWQDIVHRQEYTQLPPLVQEYFNDALESRLTVQAVTSLWRKRVDLIDLSYYRPIADRTLPPKLPEILWKMGRQASIPSK